MALDSIHLLKMLAQGHQDLAFSNLHESGLTATDVGLFRSETHKWGMAFTIAYECPAKEQIAQHEITFFPTYYI